MSFLLTQEWDIIRGAEEEYAAFISRRFQPKCEELGLRGVGGFYVQVGSGPRIISIRAVESLEALYRAMSTRLFQEVKLELQEHVENYRSKILAPRSEDPPRPHDARQSGSAAKPYEIQRGVWKLNQYCTLLPGRRGAFADFIAREYVPALRAIDFVEVTAWWDVLIGGPSEIIGEFTFKHPVDIGRLLDHEDFRRLTYTLRSEYVADHQSRILRTTERFEEPRWYRL
ncbi:MAG: hypothetical protein HY900_04995 [Deltaproteobacteria bacterium]|nr:hypothetical protein [Deltaproteobacteria bacterium]